MDGAGPMRFFFTILMPLFPSPTSRQCSFSSSTVQTGTVSPLLVTTSEDMYPIVIGIKRMIGGGDSANESNLSSWRRPCLQ